MKSTKFGSDALLLAAALFLVLFFLSVQHDRGGSADPQSTAKMYALDNSDFRIYVPADIPKQSLVSLVLGFSPSGNVDDVIETWREAVDRYKWILLASKNFRNGSDPSEVFEKLNREIESGAWNLPIDKKRIIATGLSGGGMGSHMLAFHYPNLVSGVVINTGMIEEYYFTKKADYPRGKLAVLLASPTDFRYLEMKRDRIPRKSGLDDQMD